MRRLPTNGRRNRRRILHDHDRRIHLNPQYEGLGVGKITTTDIGMEAAGVDVSHLAEAMKAKTGICTTGNSLDYNHFDDVHMENNGASVKDMEAAAIAWSCQLHDTPYVGLKVVTDIVDGDKPTPEEFMENLGNAAKSLQETLPEVIEHVCGSKRDEL